jgi:hypothetical protein
MPEDHITDIHCHNNPKSRLMIFFGLSGNFWNSNLKESKTTTFLSLAHSAALMIIYLYLMGHYTINAIEVFFLS